MTRDNRVEIERRLRRNVLTNIVAQINEHGVTMAELTNFIADEYVPLTEQLQAKRRQVDGRVRQSEAGKRTQAKRKERHQAWLDKKTAEAEDTFDYSIEVPKEPKKVTAKSTIAEMIGE